ncbi:hypothetical protein INS49_009211 [Diaporthe citri]|uniref:uncharacterized protein n=1 Tax=Diaporthe citri TaxID=83186 RepID=UPI001C80E235|nr:uncharacterized protein INS49_009211 [Diaporthe citri]KAG6360992.1 hypothetical protein INS49_009211 [Diaporthe citri]
MVKIVVPSHYSRYIVTASDLESYLQNQFGEGNDFHIEVLLNLHTNDLWHFESPRELSNKQLMYGSCITS